MRPCWARYCLLVLYIILSIKLLLFVWVCACLQTLCGFSWVPSSGKRVKFSYSAGWIKSFYFVNNNSTPHPANWRRKQCLPEHKLDPWEKSLNTETSDTEVSAPCAKQWFEFSVHKITVYCCNLCQLTQIIDFKNDLNLTLWNVVQSGIEKKYRDHKITRSQKLAVQHYSLDV